MVLGLYLLKNFKSSRRFEQLLTKNELTKEIKNLVYLSENFKVHIIRERAK